MRKVDKPLILYGKGKLGQLASQIFTKLGIPFLLHSQDDLPVISNDQNLTAVCVASSPYADVRLFLQKRGYRDIVPVWEIIDAYPEVGLHNGWRNPWSEISFADENSLDKVYNVFKDEKSIQHWRTFLAWRLHGDEFGVAPEITNAWEIKEIKELGLLITSPSHEGYNLYDVYSRQWTRLFRWMLGAENFEYIKIHAEGLELQTIFANLEWLTQKRPVIGVTVYHSEDGLWRIEKLLIDNLENYNWHFRLHAYMGQVAIFYGIPQERR